MSILLLESLHQLYSFLKEEGFDSHLNIIRNLIFSVETENKILFRKYFKTRDLQGGPGSLIDICYQGNKIKHDHLDRLKNDLLKYGNDYIK